MKLPREWVMGCRCKSVPRCNHQGPGVSPYACFLVVNVPSPRVSFLNSTGHSDCPAHIGPLVMRINSDGLFSQVSTQRGLLVFLAGWRDSVMNTRVSGNDHG